MPLAPCLHAPASPALWRCSPPSPAAEGGSSILSGQRQRPELAGGLGQGPRRVPRSSGARATAAPSGAVRSSPLPPVPGHAHRALRAPPMPPGGGSARRDFAPGAAVPSRGGAQWPRAPEIARYKWRRPPARQAQVWRWRSAGAAAPGPAATAPGPAATARPSSLLMAAHPRPEQPAGRGPGPREKPRDRVWHPRGRWCLALSLCPPSRTR